MARRSAGVRSGMGSGDAMVALLDCVELGFVRCTLGLLCFDLLCYAVVLRSRCVPCFASLWVLCCAAICLLFGLLFWQLRFVVLCFNWFGFALLCSHFLFLCCVVLCCGCCFSFVVLPDGQGKGKKREINRMGLQRFCEGDWREIRQVLAMQARQVLGVDLSVDSPKS